MRTRALWFPFLLLLACANAWAASDVRSVRLWRAPDNTRLVFDLSGPIEHNLFTLSAPDRIVIDVNNASMKANLAGLALGNTPITSLRSADRDGAGLRVVIDLKESVTPKSFTLAPNQEYGHRLVVDLFDQAKSVPVTPAPKAPTPTTQPAAAVAAAARPTQPVAPVAPSIPTRPLPAQGKGQRTIVIAIDAGHGGEDPGAIGPGGVREKNVVLQISRELQRQINAQRGYRAELVRTGDYFIPLRRRTEIARQKGADLFVSIHADAAPRSSAFGASVFALSDSGATSETARWLADSENRSDLIGGAGNVSLGGKDRMLAGVLLDLSMTATLSSSLNVGQKVLSNMGRITPLHKRRVEQAGFMVLKSPDIPSILVETGFISNPGEAGKLQAATHQQALARSITQGIRHFFEENPPPGTYIAHLRDTGRITLAAREHIVRPGESLALLADRYQVSLVSLRQTNRLSNDVIKVGQTLQIPAASVAVNQ